MLDITIDTYREAITMWLEQIHTNKGWVAAVKRGKLDDNVIMETCLQNPNHWTIRLAGSIVESSSHRIAKAVYKDRVTKATEHLKSKSRTPILRSISIENLDRLLPSQRKWLESDEGSAEKAKYLKRGLRWEEEAESINQEGEPMHKVMKPTIDSSGQHPGEQAMGMGPASRRGLEDSLEDSEDDPGVGGWSKWEGVWTARPIGMV